MAEEKEQLGKRFSRGGHSIEVVVESEALEKQRKKSQVTLKQPVGTTFTIYCDEGSYLNGDDTAPPPLAYLSSSVAF